MAHPHSNISRRTWMAATGAVLLLTACGGAPRLKTTGEVAFVVRVAWAEGRKVEYITTDVSDAAVAREQGVNHVPRLAHAVVKTPGAKSLLERVYAFPGKEQIPVFQSAPQPAGPHNTDRAYSPLWRMVAVTWKPNARVRELRSEEAVLQAEDAGEVEVAVTDVVLNCPVLRTFEAGVKPLSR